MEGLREKVISIICEEWPHPGMELDSAAIYRRLISEGVGVPEDALRDVLVLLVDHGDIKLVRTPTRPLREGGMSIRSVRPRLCR
jgi:hypothetical protein